MNAGIDRRGLQPSGEMPHGSSYPGVYQPPHPSAAQYDDAVLSQVDMNRQEQDGYAGIGSYDKNYRKYYVD